MNVLLKQKENRNGQLARKSVDYNKSIWSASKSVALSEIKSTSTGKIKVTII